MPGMPYKIGSIITRKLEGVNHFHNYLCRQLKGGGMEIYMIYGDYYNMKPNTLQLGLSL